MSTNPKQRQNLKGRRETGSFVALPHAVLKSANFHSLSGRAIKLLLALAAQYKGVNNGDLCCSMSLMGKCGWTSKDQLHKALKELLEKGWLIKTRQGGLHMGPDLYALTFRRIDECGGKLDVPATTTAPNNWKNYQPQSATRTSPPRVADQHGPITGN